MQPSRGWGRLPRVTAHWSPASGPRRRAHCFLLDRLPPRRTSPPLQRLGQGAKSTRGSKPYCTCFFFFGMDCELRMDLVLCNSVSVKRSCGPQNLECRLSGLYRKCWQTSVLDHRRDFRKVDDKGREGQQAAMCSCDTASGGPVRWASAFSGAVSVRPNASCADLGP